MDIARFSWITPEVRASESPLEGSRARAFGLELGRNEMPGGGVQKQRRVITVSWISKVSGHLCDKGHENRGKEVDFTHLP